MRAWQVICCAIYVCILGSPLIGCWRTCSGRCSRAGSVDACAAHIAALSVATGIQGSHNCHSARLPHHYAHTTRLQKPNALAIRPQTIPTLIAISNTDAPALSKPNPSHSMCCWFNPTHCAALPPSHLSACFVADCMYRHPCKYVM